MSIVNRRNAVIGWATWQVGKRVARKKAKSAVPAVESGKPNKPALVAAGVVAVGSTVLFWRRFRRDAGDEDTGDAV